MYLQDHRAVSLCSGTNMFSIAYVYVEKIVQAQNCEKEKWTHRREQKDPKSSFCVMLNTWLSSGRTPAHRQSPFLSWISFTIKHLLLAEQYVGISASLSAFCPPPRSCMWSFKILRLRLIAHARQLTAWTEVWESRTGWRWRDTRTRWKHDGGWIQMVDMLDGMLKMNWGNFL